MNIENEVHFHRVSYIEIMNNGLRKQTNETSHGGKYDDFESHPS